MDKLADYVKWIGSLDFVQYPFREADALVLCVISYYDLRPVFAGKYCTEASPGEGIAAGSAGMKKDAMAVSGGRSVCRVRDCLPMIEAGEAKLRITGGDMGNGEIFEAAVRSRRFGDLFLSDNEDILRQEPALQYASVTFHDGGRFSFIAYRGTDSTLAGWKEDFMISFTRTEAQALAADYAERVIMRESGDGAGPELSAGLNRIFTGKMPEGLPAQEPDHRWYIGGHSKGGNEALYAACMLSDEAWAKVSRVFLLDGPGFCPEVLDVSLIGRIDAKTSRIIPEFDVIGKLFEPDITDTRIIHSYREGMEQHSLASWLVDHGDLALAERNDPRTIWINESIDAWVENVPPENRQIFIDEFFDSMTAGGKDSLDEMDLESFQAALISFGGKSEAAKRTLMELPKRAIFDDALDNPDPKSEGIWNWFRNSHLAHALMLVAGGLLMLLASERILEIASLLMVITLAGVQCVLTVRYLSKNGWDFVRARERILLCIILIVSGVFLVLKDQAMFLVGSILFGTLFLVLAYLSGEKAFRRKGERFIRTINAIECVIAVIFGISFLIIPQATVVAFAIAIGGVMIIDGILRIAYYLVRGLRKLMGVL